MKLELEEAKKKAAATYNSASDFYDHPANTFQPINARDDWWPMVMGSGYRGTIELLTPTDRERLRLENIAFIERESVRSVEANVVYAVAKEVATKSTK